MYDNTLKCVTQVQKSLKDVDVLFYCFIHFIWRKCYFMVLTASWFQSDAGFQFNKDVKGRQLSYSRNLDDENIDIRKGIA